MQVSTHSRLDIPGDYFGSTATSSVIDDDACSGRGIDICRIVRISPTAEPGNQNLSVSGGNHSRIIIIVVVSRIAGCFRKIGLRTVVPVAASGKSHYRNEQQ